MTLRDHAGQEVCEGWPGPRAAFVLDGRCRRACSGRGSCGGCACVVRCRGTPRSPYWHRGWDAWGGSAEHHDRKWIGGARANHLLITTEYAPWCRKPETPVTPSASDDRAAKPLRRRVAAFPALWAPWTSKSEAWADGGRAWREGFQDRGVAQGLETLLTALHVKIDNPIGARRWTRRPPWLSDAELWDVPPDGAPVGPGRLGRLRLLRLALPVPLGAVAVSGLHSNGHADPVGAGEPEDRGPAVSADQ